MGNDIASEPSGRAYYYFWCINVCSQGRYKYAINTNLCIELASNYIKSTQLRRSKSTIEHKCLGNRRGWSGETFFFRTYFTTRF